MSSGSREDYLINILRLSEDSGVVRTSKLANFMGVSPASVTEMLNILSESGFVHYEKYKGVSLTDEGMNYAKNIRRKHHIMERFLSEFLDVEDNLAHEEACLMEHSVSDDSVNKICRMIGSKMDGDCSTCTDPCGPKDRISDLTSIKCNESCRISHLKGSDSREISELLSIGFIPGKEIKIDSFGDSNLTVNISGSSVSVDNDSARCIFIVRN